METTTTWAVDEELDASEPDGGRRAAPAPVDRGTGAGRTAIPDDPVLDEAGAVPRPRRTSR